MNKYPFVKQLDIKDCGVACLSMIIDYFGGHIDYSLIKENLHVDKSGVNAYNIVSYASNIGFDSKGLKKSLEELNNVDLPCIAYTIDNGYKHYVVIYRIDNKKIVIADPMIGIKKVRKKDFKKIYQGIILVFNPIHNIPYIKNKYSMSKLIKNIILKEKTEVVKTILLSVGITLLYILSSFYTRTIINNQFNINNLYILFIAFLSIEIFKLVFQFIRNKITIIFNNKIDYIITNDVFKKMIFLPYSFYKNKTVGEVITRYNDLNKVKNFISKILFSIFIDLILSLIVFIVLLIINVKLTLVVFLSIIIYSLIIKLFSKIIYNKINNYKIEDSKINSYIIENLNGFESIKGTNLEYEIVNEFQNKYNSFLFNKRSLQKNYLYEDTIKNMIYYFTNITIIFISSILMLKNTINIGDFILYQSLVSYFFMSFNNITDVVNDYKEYKISIKRIEDIFVEQNNDNKIFIDNINKIEINDLSYYHNNITNILKNINLNISPKEKIMLVGESGSGKSTLLKIIKSYFKAKNIKINDIELNKLDKETKDKINYISQSEVLFTDTIYNNIVMKRKVKYSHFLEICKIFKIDDLIKNKKLNYDYLIEENGFNLSGGEKQRIILARNFIKESDVYLLDESLSQVDINLERIIIKNLFKYYNNKIIVFVSHRKDNLDLFDRMITMNDKTIVADIKR